MPVIEVYARGETEYESSGRYYTFKKTVPLTAEQLKEITKFNEFTKKNLITIINESFLTEIEELDGFYEILELCNDFLEEKHIDYIVEKEDLEERYYLDDGQNLYMEFFFKDDNVDGYVSVYDMPIEDLEKETKDSINLFFTKYLTDN